MGSRLGSRHGPRGRPRRSHLCPTLRFIRGLSRLRRRAWRLYTLGHWRRSGWSTWGRRLPLGLYRAAILDRRRRLRTAHLTAPLLIAPLRPARPLGSGRDLGSALLAARRRRRLRTAEVRLRRLHLRLRAAILDRRRRLRTAHLTAPLLIAPLRPARPLGSGRDLGSALLAARRRRRLRTAEVRLRRLHLRLRAAILDRRRRLRTAHLTATLLIAPLRPARPLGSGRDLGSALLAARRRRRLRTAEVRLRRLHLRLRAAILDRRRRLRTAHLTATLLIAPLRPARPLGSGRDLGSALLAARRRDLLTPLTLARADHASFGWPSLHRCRLHRFRRRDDSLGGGADNRCGCLALSWSGTLSLSARTDRARGMRPSGDHRAGQRSLGRRRGFAARGDKAGRRRGDPQISAHWLEPAHVDLRRSHTGLVNAAPAEMVLLNRHDGILNTGVPVDRDIVHIDDGRLVDDDIVDHPRSAPAAPPRTADETRPAPPRHYRLTPAERNPAHHRRTNAHVDAG